MTSAKRISRRGFLKTSATAGALAASTFYVPRLARATTPPSVKRLLIVYAHGGCRWDAMFDGQTNVQQNPWGLVPQSYFGSTPQPGWGVSRLLLQTPLWMNTTDWSNMFSYISSSNTYNLNRVTLSQWGGATLPTLLDVANDIAVVRCTANPGGTFNSDHKSAAHAMATGYNAGQVGMTTMFNQMLQNMLGSSFPSTYALPASALGSYLEFGLGVGPFASARPLALADPTQVPTKDPGSSVSVWGHKMESDVDTALQGSLQGTMGQSVADFISDKANGDAYAPKLIDPALQLGSTTANGTATLGTLKDGSTPVTNAMIYELFGLSDTVTPTGDTLFDAFGAQHNTKTPTWTPGANDYGINGALAVRLLQKGAPVVSMSVGYFDSHSFEVIDPIGQFSHPVHCIKLARMLRALDFGLRNIADPVTPGATLWDSTVVMVCSEFGRTVVSSSTNGFNSPDGSNDGGSDHGMWCAWPLLGGPVAGAGKLFVASDNGGFFHQNRIFTTIMQGMGLTTTDDANGYLPYATFPAISPANQYGSLLSGVA